MVRAMALVRNDVALELGKLEVAAELKHVIKIQRLASDLDGVSTSLVIRITDTETPDFKYVQPRKY